MAARLQRLRLVRSPTVPCVPSTALAGEEVKQLIAWLERSGALLEAPLLRALRCAPLPTAPGRAAKLLSGADLAALRPDGYKGMVSGRGAVLAGCVGAFAARCHPALLWLSKVQTATLRRPPRSCAASLTLASPGSMDRQSSACSWQWMPCSAPSPSGSRCGDGCLGCCAPSTARRMRAPRQAPSHLHGLPPPLPPCPLSCLRTTRCSSSTSPSARRSPRLRRPTLPRACWQQRRCSRRRAASASSGVTCGRRPGGAR